MALLAGVLTAGSCSHALPLARETNPGRSAPAIASGPTAFVIPNPFPSASLGAPARASRSRRSVPCPTHRRIPPSCGCRPRHRRAGAGTVSFGSSSVAGVEGSAWASEATAAAAAAAGFDRDPVARGVGVDGGVGAPAGAADEISDEAVGACSSAAAAAAAASKAAVVDQGELICQKLEGVVCREVEVANQEILLRVAHLDDYFAIAGEYIRKFHRPLPWSWELICRQLEEVISQEAEMAEEQILLRMANLDDYCAIACECIGVLSEVFRSFVH